MSYHFFFFLPFSFFSFAFFRRRSRREVVRANPHRLGMRMLLAGGKDDRHDLRFQFPADRAEGG